jgi:Protein of unknown function (DUF501)
VKCLHAHLAWWLAGGDDPVGAWVASELDDPSLAAHRAAPLTLVEGSDAVVDGGDEL